MIKEIESKRLLVLAPHTDDEFGCGGTMARLCEEGAEIYYAAFSTCEQSVPEGYPGDILAKEVRKATSQLGVKTENLFIYDFKVRYFPERRQAILEELVKLRKKIEPDLIMLPAPVDIHQDHHVISMEGLRAFKFASVFGYELPWNDFNFHHSCFMQLMPRHVERKIEALGCYESQSFRPYADPAFIRALAKVRGVQAGCEYAESFEVLRLMY